jgi:hypothetical protein
MQIYLYINKKCHIYQQKFLGKKGKCLYTSYLYLLIFFKVVFQYIQHLQILQLEAREHDACTTKIVKNIYLSFLCLT